MKTICFFIAVLAALTISGGLAFAAVLNPPTINSPGDTFSPGSVLTTLTPTFTWSSVTGATGYGLYIRDLTTNTLVFNNVGGAKTGTSYALPAGYLTAGHSFRWAMTTFNASGEGAQSSYRYFQTGQANLTPYQPSGWSDKIVTSTATGNNTDSASLTTADTLYIDWAVINNGTLATDTTFYTQLFVDGILQTAWNTPPPMSAGSYTYVQDYSIGSLSPGTHTIKIVTDSSGVITESSEGDNQYTKTITVNALPPPTIISPGDATSPGSVFSTLTPTFTWNAVSGATGYGLYIRDVTTNTLVFNNNGGAKTGTSYSLSSGYLTAGHSFRWAMTSFTGSTESVQSSYRYFQTGQANLTPYQPSGWSDKIVTSTATGNNTDSASLTTADTLYVDWAVINNGTLATDTTFYTQLFVDGILQTAWNTPPPMSAGSYTYVQDYSIGSLSAGTHTIKIVTDSSGVITESSEGDNQYTKTITVAAATSPNLTPYQPSGWSDKIVVSRTTGNNTDSTSLTTADSLYVDWAVINNGTGATAATAATFYTELYVDGVLKTTFNTPPPLNAGSYASFADYSVGTLSAGTHTIVLKTDSTSVIAESNESDNQFTKTIAVATATSPNLTPYQPAGWSDKIVVSRATGNNSDSTSLTSVDTLYIDWAVTNNGSAATGSTFYSELYVDGVLRNTWNTPPPLGVNSNAFIQDYSIGTLSAGTHTVLIKTDSTGAIAENNENDNQYTKTITIDTVAGTSPTVTQQPQSQTVTAGSSVSLAVSAIGNPQPFYQWRVNGINIAGATSSTLNLANVATSQAGTYSVVVSNSQGSISASAQLNITPAGSAPTIITQPKSQTVAVGDGVIFSVGANGAMPLNYAWLKNGTNLLGASGSSLALSSVTTADAGNYSVLVSNAVGGPTVSTAATLTVINNAVAPTITAAPKSQTAAGGESLTLHVAATGTGPLTYQWKRNGQIVPTATGNTFSINSFTSSAVGSYTVFISNSAGVSSHDFTLSLRKVILIHGTWNNTDYDALKNRLMSDFGYMDQDILDTNLSAYDPNDSLDKGKTGGRKSIGESVSYVRSQIIQKWITQTLPIDVDIVAHSGGGLAARRFVNKSNFADSIASAGSNFPPIPLCRVHNLLTLGTPYGGIQGCDGLAEQLVGGAIIKDMRVRSTFKNSDYGPLVHNLNAFLIIDNDHSYFGRKDGINYWGLGGNTRFPTNALYSNAFFTEPELFDGLVNIRSAYGAEPFPDTAPRNEPNFHIVGVNHGQLPTGGNGIDTISSYILPALQGKSWPAETPQLAGIRSAGATVALPSSASQSSQMVESRDLVLTQDQGQQSVIPIDACTKASFTLFSYATCAFSLQKPDGTVIDASTSDPNVIYAAQTGVDGGIAYSFIITSPDVGNWSVLINPSAIPAGQNAASLTIIVTNGLSLLGAIEATEYENGAAPFVRATLKQDGNPLTTASALITISDPAGQTSTATLLDDGLHNDGAASDGTYGSQLASLTTGGVYDVNFKVIGTNANGERYQRVGSSFFTIGPATASLTNTYADSGVDNDLDGILNALAVNVSINVSVAGKFSVQADLRDSAGNLIDSASGSEQSTPVGANTITLFFSGQSILSHGAPGFFKVENIRLYTDTDARPILIGTDLAGYTTSSYAVAQFDASPVMSSQPQSQTVVFGSSITLSAGATGAAPFSYQWRFNGSDIPNATGPTLNLTNITGTNNGSYSLVVSNAAGSVTSSAASLVVQFAFDQWQSQYFNPSQLADPTAGGPNGDANGSGIPNLLKYFFDLNPTSTMSEADYTALPNVSLANTNGLTYLTLAYRQSARALNLSMHIQISSTLLPDSWQTVIPDVIENLAPDPNTGDPKFKVKVNVTGEPKKFIRLQVTTP